MTERIVPDTSARGLIIPISSGISGTYRSSFRNNDGTSVHQWFTIHQNIAVLNAEGNSGQGAGKNIKTQSGNYSEDDDGNGWICKTEEKKISMDDNTFMTVDYEAQAAHIFPGAVYTYTNFTNGSWKDEIYNRNPLRLSASVYNTTGPNYEDVEEPGMATITNGIANLFRRFSRKPDEVTSGSMMYTAYEIENLSDAYVKIGASGYGFGFYASNLFQFSEKEKHKYFMIDCMKEMFTVSTQIPRNGFFTDASLETNDMMFISSVTYGVRILAFMEIDTHERIVSDKFEAGGSWGVAGGQVDIDALSSQFASSSTIKMYVVGGRSDQVYPVYSIAELKERCAAIAASVNYNTVQPVKYELKNLQNEVVLSGSATDKFTSRSCSYQEPEAPPKDIQVKVKLTRMQTNFDNSDAELYGQVWAQVFDGNGKEIMPAYGKDRLFSLDQGQHLTANELHGFYHPPGLEPSFVIPGNSAPGAKLIIYYWLMEYNTVGSDDFLSMRGGAQKVYNRNHDRYYVSEIYLDNIPSEPVETQFTADGEGVFTLQATVSKSLIQ